MPPILRSTPCRPAAFSAWLATTLLLATCPTLPGWAQLPVGKNLTVQEDQLSAEQLRDFRKLTEQKVAELQNYLAVVADPGQPDQIREMAIDNALQLFVPDAAMQVGSTKGGKMLVKEYPLPVYLRRLKNLDKKYFDVTITFYDLALVGDWEKTRDGYVTTATYFQRFRGVDRQGRVQYSAKTAKNLDVDLRNRKDPFYEEHRWTVLLGDVRVAEMQPRRTAP